MSTVVLGSNPSTEKLNRRSWVYADPITNNLRNKIGNGAWFTLQFVKSLTSNSLPVSCLCSFLLKALAVLVKQTEKLHLKSNWLLSGLGAKSGWILGARAFLSGDTFLPLTLWRMGSCQVLAHLGPWESASLSSVSRPSHVGSVSSELPQRAG